MCYCAPTLQETVVSVKNDTKSQETNPVNIRVGLLILTCALEVSADGGDRGQGQGYSIFTK